MVHGLSRPWWLGRHLGSDFANGTPAADANPQLSSDIVNQTAGDTVCQQAYPALSTQW